MTSHPCQPPAQCGPPQRRRRGRSIKRHEPCQGLYPQEVAICAGTRLPLSHFSCLFLFLFCQLTRPLSLHNSHLSTHPPSQTQTPSHTASRTHSYHHRHTRTITHKPTHTITHTHHHTLTLTLTWSGFFLSGLDWASVQWEGPSGRREGRGATLHWLSWTGSTGGTGCHANTKLPPDPL